MIETQYPGQTHQLCTRARVPGEGEVRGWLASGCLVRGDLRLHGEGEI